MKPSLALALALVLCPRHAARAADHTFTVTTTDDGIDVNPGDGTCATSGGQCTLRAAVMEANHTASGTVEIVVPANANAYVLTIPPSGADDETTGDLNVVYAGLVITGGGAAHTIVDGNGADRVFDASYTSLLVSGLTIRNGTTSGNGGGLLSDPGFLAMSDCVVTGNTASAGGGIYNHASFQALILERTTVSGNVATSGGGGGIYADYVSVAASTLSGNRAQTVGGGLYLTGLNTGNLVYYSTIAGNRSESDNYGLGAGGGLFSDDDLYQAVTVTGTIIAGNFEIAPGPAINPSDCGGYFFGGTNMVGDTSHCTIPATVANPALGPLQLNGGQVPTRALLSGSPAIDAGDPTCGFYSMFRQPKTTTDERGAQRPTYGVRCSIGAYEYDANGDVNGDGKRDVADVFYLINLLFANGPAPIGLGDVNGDTFVDVADVFFLINFLFAGGPAPL